MRAPLAERLGLISAAEAERLDGLELDTAVNRALRLAGVPTSCAARARPRGDGRRACLRRWQRREQRLPLNGCTSRHAAGHALLMAWEVRALRAGGERCA